MSRCRPMRGLKSTAMDVQVRVRRKRFTRCRLPAGPSRSRRPPHPVPEQPQRCISLIGPHSTARMRPWCFQPADHSPSNFTRGILRGVFGRLLHAFYIASIYHSKHAWPQNTMPHTNFRVSEPPREAPLTGAGGRPFCRPTTHRRDLRSECSQSRLEHDFQPDRGVSVELLPASLGT